jgi:outer membrane protein OmpA-like peptidoglycan-associated protein
MRARLWLLPLLLSALVGAGAAVAEPIGGHWELTPFGGFTIFDPKLRYPGDNLPLADDLYLGGRLSYETRSWIGFEVAAGTTPTAQDIPTGALEYDFFHASGNFVISPAKNRWGTPYAFVGGGYTQLKPASGAKTETGAIEFGGGLKLWMTDAGLTFAIGATPRDTDGDGVPDKKDKCPDTPKGATVDAAGCPSDADADGVLTGLDMCPGTPRGATVDVKGCPADADSDGVFNGVDKCADTPRGAKADSLGCPMDTDGDGVLDGIDQCPNTPTGALVDLKGCPLDTDGDGVPDGIDQCANTPPGIKVSADGCAIVVNERETELFDTGLMRLQNVNFATGKADVPPEATPDLDVVGAVMVRWPEMRIEVGGHTDSRGSAAKNQKLSEARADSVLSYIVRKYPMLDRSHFTVKGYGSSKPLAPNTNDLNRAKNRRVELVAINKEVLTKEYERRRALRTDEAAPADSTKK